MSERKLASVQKIKNLEPIEGRDRIELATIEGFKVIVGKGDFKIGDLCVYIECDSVLDPDNPVFEQARKRANRVRIMKMGSIYSEGIAYPISALLPNDKDWKEGDDVTGLLHIVKYDEYGDANEVPQPVKKPKYNTLQRIWYRIFGFPKREKKDDFPSLVKRTDETRLQNISEVLENKEPVIVSEKLNGTSATYLLEKVGWFGKEKFTVASRNHSLGKDGSHYWEMAEKYDLQERMSLMMEQLDVPWICLQGEIIGPSIQKNPYKLKERDFFVFNLITPYGRYGTEKMAEICYNYGIPTVPILDSNYILPDSVDVMLKVATGRSMINNEGLREGVVVRSKDGKHSFKAVSPEYLIRYD